jgi:hypothetical protein
MTNKELEPMHPYWGVGADSLPDKYAHDFDAMARNSAFRYLG